VADYQVVDVANPYAEDSYLEIEQALLQGRGRDLRGSHAAALLAGRARPQAGVTISGVAARALAEFLARGRRNHPRR
jgi:hypothetical protein